MASKKPDFRYTISVRTHTMGLKEMVETCRSALRGLPSYPLIAEATGGLGARFVRYQSLNLSEHLGDHGALAQWADRETPAGSGLRWWETAAATGSSLGLFALIAAASWPELSPSQGTAIAEAYWPWAGALHILLDSVADEALDTAAGQRSLLDYYASPEEAASRLQLLASETMQGVSELPRPNQHAVILAGMVASYLSSVSPLSTRAQLIYRAVLEGMGAIVKPSMFIFRVRRAAARLDARRVRLSDASKTREPTHGPSASIGPSLASARIVALAERAQATHPAEREPAGRARPTSRG